MVVTLCHILEPFWLPPLLTWELTPTNATGCYHKLNTCILKAKTLKGVVVGLPAVLADWQPFATIALWAAEVDKALVLPLLSHGQFLLL